MDSMSSAELESILAERLDFIKKEKQAIRESIDDLDGKIKNQRELQKKCNAPREKDEELALLMQKLEHSHATTPQNNAEEREFMREKEKIKQKRKKIQDNAKIQADIDALKAKLAEYRRQQSELDDSQTELTNGLKRIRIANRAGCATHEIIEKKYTVEFSRVGSIVGKGGSNLRAIEAEHKVSIEIDGHNDGSLRILGQESGVSSAYAAILTIVETTVEEFRLSDESITCLLMDKALRVNQLQTKHAVRMDVSRAKNLCKITGLTDSVRAAKEEVVGLQGVRTDILIDPSMMPALFGKGLANVTAWQEEFGISININRDRNTIEVVGVKADVSKAVEKIKESVDANKEVEEILKMEKHVLLGCLIGSGGQVVRSISRDCGVRIDTEGSKDEKFQTIKIKGTVLKVAAAKEYVLQLVGGFIASTLMFEVDEEVIPAILGKGGADIKALREKYKDTHIDIDGTIVHIQSSSAEQRERVKDEFDAVIQANYVQAVMVGEDGVAQFKFSKSQSIRDKLKELNVKVLIDKDNATMKLRGLKRDVLQGVELIEAFKTLNHVLRIPLPEEDLLLCMRTTDDNLAKLFEQRFDVEVAANKKDSCLVLRGPESKLSVAKEGIEAFFRGDLAHGSIVMAMPSIVLSAMIGKAGAHIGKMEEELQVRFDTMKSSDQLRIRGGEGVDKLLAARDAVNIFILNTRVTDSVELMTHLADLEVEQVTKRCSDLFNVEILTATKNSQIKIFTIKGTYLHLADSTQFLRDELSSTYSYSIPIHPLHHSKLEQLQVAQSITARYSSGQLTCEWVVSSLSKGGSQEVATATAALVVHGPKAAVLKEKRSICKQVMGLPLLRDEMSVVELSLACIRDLFDGRLLTELQSAGVVLKIDRVDGFVLVSGPRDVVASAVATIKGLRNTWQECNIFIPVDKALISMLVGKNGVTINALRKEVQQGVTIDVSAGGVGVDVKGSSRAVAEEAKEVVLRKVQQIQSELFEVDAPADFLPVLIGKQGATINKLRADTETTIDIEGCKIRVRGSADRVVLAKGLVLDMLNAYNAQNAGLKSFVIPSSGIPVLIGSKGSTIRELQLSTGVKMEMDRGTCRLTIRGSIESVEKAVQLIEDLFSKSGVPSDCFSPPPVEVPAAVPYTPTEQSSAAGVDSSDRQRTKVLPGAAPAVLQRMVQLSMSKSALKRMRKKQATIIESSSSSSFTHDEGSATIVEEEEEEEDEEEDDAATATATTAAGPSSSGVDVATIEEKDAYCEEEEEKDAHAVEDGMMAVLTSSSTAAAASTNPPLLLPSNQPPPLSIPIPSIIPAPLNGEVASASASSSASSAPLYSSQMLGPSSVPPPNIAMRPSYPQLSLSSSSPAQNQFNLLHGGTGSSISTDNLLNLLIGKTEPSKPLIPLSLLDTRLHQPAAAATPAYYGANGLQYHQYHHHPAQSQQLQFNAASLLSSQTARYNSSNSIIPLAADKMTVPPPPGMDFSPPPSSGASLSSLAAVPPPGLSPTYFTPKMNGSSSTTAAAGAAAVSKFTFADYRPESNGSATAELKHPSGGADPLLQLSLPVHVSSSKISSLSSLLSQSSLSQQQQQHGPAPNLMDGYSSSSSRGSLQQQQPRPTQSLQQQQQQQLQPMKSTPGDANSSSSGGGNYYKSKSGFSVRL